MKNRISEIRRMERNILNKRYSDLPSTIRFTKVQYGYTTALAIRRLMADLAMENAEFGNLDLEDLQQMEER